ncbi:hypothetical protein PVAP13_1NG383400 [Panicum virgatum]|uniref:Uncharacterized protein n=1 Tax=Panicum virgatum TaxID=38727 RepID=A0A8T0WZ42_PANVG|nr:hypothetical protein PVAP13_1NG383400 [Panicum virgatum]
MATLRTLGPCPFLPCRRRLWRRREDKGGKKGRMPPSELYQAGDPDRLCRRRGSPCTAPPLPCSNSPLRCPCPPQPEPVRPRRHFSLVPSLCHVAQPCDRNRRRLLPCQPSSRSPSLLGARMHVFARWPGPKVRPFGLAAAGPCSALAHAVPRHRRLVATPRDGDCTPQPPLSCPRRA